MSGDAPEAGKRRRAGLVCNGAYVRAVLLGALLLLLGATGRARAEEQVVPVRFHVVRTPSGPIAGEDFVAAQLAQANAVFRRARIRFVDAGRAALPEPHRRLVTRADRDALGAYLQPGAVDCMIVGTLMDVDEPGRERRGVHWHVRGQKRHFVIVSAISGPYVLAHELGHFLGNRAHSATPGNIMSYESRPGVPSLDQGQLRRIRRTLRRMRASGELRPPG